MKMRMSRVKTTDLWIHSADRINPHLQVNLGKVHRTSADELANSAYQTLTQMEVQGPKANRTQPG